MTLIDSHCHIDGEAFDEDRDEVVQRARDAGVAAMLNVGTGDPHSDDFRRAVAVAERYESVYASVGVHPHDAKLYDDAGKQGGTHYAGPTWMANDQSSVVAMRVQQVSAPQSDAIAWLLRHHPEVPEAQVCKLLGTTKATVQAVRDRTHWKSQEIRPRDPVLLGLCGQIELDDAVLRDIGFNAEQMHALVV